MKLKYIVLVGALFSVPLLSHAFKGARPGGGSIFLPRVEKNNNNKNREPKPNTPRVEYDINGVTEEGEVNTEGLAFGENAGFGADTVTEASTGVVVVGTKKAENESWIRRSVTVASKFVVNLFPTAQAGVFKDKMTALTGAFRNAINESAAWDPDTRANLGKLIQLSEVVGVPEAIEQVKGIPKEDEVAQREWVEDMKCKCNPAVCPI